MTIALLSLLSWLVVLSLLVGHWPAAAFSLVLSWLVLRQERNL